MATQPLYFNGIDGATGRYALPPASPRQLAALARHAVLDPAAVEELRLWLDALRGARDGVDVLDLAQAGWGVIFAAGDESAPAVREALAPLLAHRRSQMSSYRELAGEDGYRPGESKPAFLARHGMGPGAADPRRLPYYLLLVGDPEAIPYSFQYQLDVQHAVGRIHFETLEEYASYARAVVAAETAPPAKRPLRAAFFAPRHPDDPPTALSCDDLVEPLAAWLATHQPEWEVRTVLREEATKGSLRRLLGGNETPDLLFTAGHGLFFASGHPWQHSHQGALLCQEWPGPRQWQGPVPPELYFGADDLAPAARLSGLIAFHFACYTAGVPARDDFPRVWEGERAAVAPRAFLARLPQRLLGHPGGGALAVVGHVDRVWECSIHWPGAGRQIQAFEDTLNRLLAGCPVGAAMELFGQRYAELASDLSLELEEICYGRPPDDALLAGLWTACHDCRNYVVVGDPAVRLPVPP